MFRAEGAESPDSNSPDNPSVISEPSEFLINQSQTSFFEPTFENLNLIKEGLDDMYHRLFIDQPEYKKEYGETLQYLHTETDPQKLARFKEENPGKVFMAQKYEQHSRLLDHLEAFISPSEYGGSSQHYWNSLVTDGKIKLPISNDLQLKLFEQEFADIPGLSIVSEPVSTEFNPVSIEDQTHALVFNLDERSKKQLRLTNNIFDPNCIELTKSFSYTLPKYEMQDDPQKTKKIIETNLLDAKNAMEEAGVPRQAIENFLDSDAAWDYRKFGNKKEVLFTVHTESGTNGMVWAEEPEFIPYKNSVGFILGELNQELYDINTYSPENIDKRIILLEQMLQQMENYSQDGQLFLLDPESWINNNLLFFKTDPKSAYDLRSEYEKVSERLLVAKAFKQLYIDVDAFNSMAKKYGTADFSLEKLEESGEKAQESMAFIYSLTQSRSSLYNDGGSPPSEIIYPDEPILDIKSPARFQDALLFNHTLISNLLDIYKAYGEYKQNENMGGSNPESAKAAQRLVSANRELQSILSADRKSYSGATIKTQGLSKIIIEADLLEKDMFLRQNLTPEAYRLSNIDLLEKNADLKDLMIDFESSFSQMQSAQNNIQAKFDEFDSDEFERMATDIGRTTILDIGWQAIKHIKEWSFAEDIRYGKEIGFQAPSDFVIYAQESVVVSYESLVHSYKNLHTAFSNLEHMTEGEKEEFLGPIIVDYLYSYSQYVGSVENYNQVLADFKIDDVLEVGEVAFNQAMDAMLVVLAFTGAGSLASIFGRLGLKEGGKLLAKSMLKWLTNQGLRRGGAASFFTSQAFGATMRASGFAAFFGTAHWKTMENTNNAINNFWLDADADPKETLESFITEAKKNRAKLVGDVQASIQTPDEASQEATKTNTLASISPEEKDQMIKAYDELIENLTKLKNTSHELTTGDIVGAYVQVFAVCMAFEASLGTLKLANAQLYEMFPAAMPKWQMDRINNFKRIGEGMLRFEKMLGLNEGKLSLGKIRFRYEKARSSIRNDPLLTNRAKSEMLGELEFTMDYINKGFANSKNPLHSNFWKRLRGNLEVNLLKPYEFFKLESAKSTWLEKFMPEQGKGLTVEFVKSKSAELRKGAEVGSIQDITLVENHLLSIIQKTKLYEGFNLKTLKNTGNITRPEFWHERAGKLTDEVFYDILLQKELKILETERAAFLRHKELFRPPKGQELTKEFVKSRYNEYAKKHHPDKTGSQTSPSEFGEVKIAYNYLVEKIALKERYGRNIANDLYANPTNTSQFFDMYPEYSRKLLPAPRQDKIEVSAGPSIIKPQAKPRAASKGKNNVDPQHTARPDISFVDHQSQRIPQPLNSRETPNTSMQAPVEAYKQTYSNSSFDRSRLDQAIYEKDPDAIYSSLSGHLFSNPQLISEVDVGIWGLLSTEQKISLGQELARSDEPQLARLRASSSLYANDGVATAIGQEIARQGHVDIANRLIYDLYYTGSRADALKIARVLVPKNPSLAIQLVNEELLIGTQNHEQVLDLMAEISKTGDDAAKEMTNIFDRYYTGTENLNSIVSKVNDNPQLLETIRTLSENTAGKIDIIQTNVHGLKELGIQNWGTQQGLNHIEEIIKADKDLGLTLGYEYLENSLIQVKDKSFYEELDAALSTNYPIEHTQRIIQNIADRWNIDHDSQRALQKINLIVDRIDPIIGHILQPNQSLVVLEKIAKTNPEFFGALTAYSIHNPVDYLNADFRDGGLSVRMQNALANTYPQKALEIFENASTSFENTGDILFQDNARKAAHGIAKSRIQIGDEYLDMMLEAELFEQAAIIKMREFDPDAALDYAKEHLESRVVTNYIITEEYAGLLQKVAIDALESQKSSGPQTIRLANIIMDIDNRFNFANAITPLHDMLVNKPLNMAEFSNFADFLVDKEILPKSVRLYIPTNLNSPTRLEKKRFNFLKELVKNHFGQLETILETVNSIPDYDVMKNQDEIMGGIRDMGTITPGLFEQYREVSKDRMLKKDFLDRLKAVRHSIFRDDFPDMQGFLDELYLELAYNAYEPKNLAFSNFEILWDNVEGRTYDLASYIIPKDGYTFPAQNSYSYRQGQESNIASTLRDVNSYCSSIQSSGADPMPALTKICKLQFNTLDQGEVYSLFSIIDPNNLNFISKANSPDPSTQHGLLREFSEYVKKDLKTEYPLHIQDYLEQNPNVFAELTRLLSNNKKRKALVQQLKSVEKSYANLDEAGWNEILADPAKTAILLSDLIHSKVMLNIAKQATVAEAGFVIENQNNYVSEGYRMFVIKNKPAFLTKASSGICTAADVRLYENPNHFDFAMVNNNDVCIGGVQAHVINVDGKEALLLRGFNPSETLLTRGELTPEGFCEGALDIARQFAEDNHISRIYITGTEDAFSALSNRESITNYMESNYVGQNPKRIEPYPITGGRPEDMVQPKYIDEIHLIDEIPVSEPISAESVSAMSMPDQLTYSDAPKEKTVELRFSPNTVKLDLDTDYHLTISSTRIRLHHDGLSWRAEYLSGGKPLLELPTGKLRDYNGFSDAPLPYNSCLIFGTRFYTLSSSDYLYPGIESIPGAGPGVSNPQSVADFKFEKILEYSKNPNAFINNGHGHGLDYYISTTPGFYLRDNFDAFLQDAKDYSSVGATEVLMRYAIYKPELFTNNMINQMTSACETEPMLKGPLFILTYSKNRQELPISTLETVFSDITPEDLSFLSDYSKRYPEVFTKDVRTDIFLRHFYNVHLSSNPALSDAFRPSFFASPKEARDEFIFLLKEQTALRDLSEAEIGSWLDLYSRNETFEKVDNQEQSLYSSLSNIQRFEQRRAGIVADAFRGPMQIRHFERYDFDQLNNTLEKLEDPPTDYSHTMVVVTPHADYNAALWNTGNALSHLDADLNTFYFEVSSPEGTLIALNQLKNRLNPSQKPVIFLLAGHGTGSSLQVGQGINGFINTTDFTQANSIKNRYPEGSIFITLSCNFGDKDAIGSVAKKALDRYKHYHGAGKVYVDGFAIEYKGTDANGNPVMHIDHHGIEMNHTDPAEALGKNLDASKIGVEIRDLGDGHSTLYYSESMGHTSASLQICTIKNEQIGPVLEQLEKYRIRHPDLDIYSNDPSSAFRKSSFNSLNSNYKRWKYENYDDESTFLDFMHHVNDLHIPHHIAPFMGDINFVLSNDYNLTIISSSPMPMYEGNNPVFSLSCRDNDANVKQMMIKMDEGIDEQYTSMLFGVIGVNNYAITSYSPDFMVMEKVEGMDVKQLAKIGYDPSSGLAFDDISKGGKYYEQFLYLRGRTHAIATVFSIPDRHLGNCIIDLKKTGDGYELTSTDIDLKGAFQHFPDKLHQIEFSYDDMFGPGFLRDNQGNLHPKFIEGFNQAIDDLRYQFSAKQEDLKMMTSEMMADPIYGDRLREIPVFDTDPIIFIEKHNSILEVDNTVFLKKFIGME